MIKPARVFLLLLVAAGSAGVVPGAARRDLTATSIGAWKGVSPDGHVQTLVTYEDRGQGLVVATIRNPDEAGNLVVSIYYAFKLDGKEYPLSARDQQGIGSIVHRVAGDDTLEYEIKVDGKVTTRGARTFSRDGHTMTLISRDGTRAPRVLQKQD
jgi:hypothetical protein